MSERDPLTGKEVTVLWVKGSGGDLGSMKLDGFATLYQEKLEGLKTLYRGPTQEDEMVGYLPHCTFNLNPRAASIDTPLHGFLPYAHVDHMHPDAVIAIAASKNSRALTREIYGDSIGWLPWRRPGFELGLMLEKFARDNPQGHRRGSGKPRPVHLGQRRPRLLRDHDRHHQQGDRLARRKASRAGEAGLRRRFRGGRGAGGAARDCGRADGRDPRRDRQVGQQGRSFRR